MQTSQPIIETKLNSRKLSQLSRPATHIRAGMEPTCFKPLLTKHQFQRKNTVAKHNSMVVPTDLTPLGKKICSAGSTFVG